MGLIADPMPCGVKSLRYGVRLPALAFVCLETGRNAIFMVDGSYGFHAASQPSAEVPPDPADRSVHQDGGDAQARFPSASGLGVGT